MNNPKPKAQKTKSAAAAPRCCRNLVEVAGALGIRLYDVRLKRGKQLERLKAEIEKATEPRPDKSGKQSFPLKRSQGRTSGAPSEEGGKVSRKAKQPSFWMFDEVQAWGKANLVLSKNKRDWTVRPEAVEPRPDNMLPVQESPAEGDLFEMPGAAFEKTLDLWEDKLKFPEKWMMAPLQGWQMRLLQKHRPQLFELGDAGTTAAAEKFGAADEFQGGLEAVASYIQLRFPGVVCNKQDISNWRKGKYLPEAARLAGAFFPPSHNSGRNQKSLIDPWVEKYLKPAAVEQNLPMPTDSKSRKEAAEASMAEMAEEQMRKEKSGLYTLTETARRTATAIGSVARNNAREAMERQLPRRFASGLEAIVPAAPMRDRLLEHLRTAAVASFTLWQEQMNTQLTAMTSKLEAKGGE